MPGEPSGPRGGRLPARLVYDTRFQPMPTGTRTVGARARRVLLVANDLEITLEVTPAARPDQVNVMGTVALEGLPLAAMVGVDGPGGRTDLETDDQGEFHLDGAARGHYSFQIDTPSCMVEVRSLNLEEA